jgi:ATP-dependent Zn protease
MSQLSLNLIAIAIFSITMSALLGPLVDISPLVPTFAVAGLLGLAAIDTFNWQGKGSTLMLDWFASFSAAHRDRVTHHEAGHFLVAQKLGIPVTGYTLSAWEAFRQGIPGLGGVQFSTQELDQELQNGTISANLLDRYCTIWLAGGVAENLVFGTVEGGADDRQKLLGVLSQLQLPPAQIQQKQRWAALQAKTLLEENWQAYEAIVVAMKQQASVEECSQQMETSVRIDKT